jgi:3-hydroxypropanoate dehydrogenase
MRSADGKATLAGLAAEPNKQKILKAPVTVIIGHVPPAVSGTPN